jgi:hypothetical protein
MPASCFPYATGTQRIDLDHTQAYLPPARGGPPGQTGGHNLGPLSRLEHRIKTFARWQVRQPEPGVWIWRSPHHASYLVTNAGTQYLGNGSFAGRSGSARPRSCHPPHPPRSPSAPRRTAPRRRSAARDERCRRLCRRVVATVRTSRLEPPVMLSFLLLPSLTSSSLRN